VELFAHLCPIPSKVGADSPLGGGMTRSLNMDDYLHINLHIPYIFLYKYI
jgi:hypothetical protein